MERLAARLAVALLALALALALVAGGAATAAGEGTDCPSAERPDPNAPVRPAHVRRPVALTVDKGSELLTWRFGAQDEEASWPVRIKAAPNLAEVHPDQIRVTTSRLVRDDSHERFPAPVVTRPQFTLDEQNVVFTVCANPEGVKPGKYTGSVLVDGPPRLTGARLAVEVTVKAGGLRFGLVLFFAFLFALLALTVKGYGDYKAHVGLAGTPRFREGILYLWHPLDRAVSTVLGLGAAVLAAILLYHNSDVWGEDLFVDALTMVQAAVTAVGAQALLNVRRAS